MEVASVRDKLGLWSGHVAHSSAVVAMEVQETRSDSPCSPKPLLPTASHGREGMLSLGAVHAQPCCVPMHSPLPPCALLQAVRLLPGVLMCHSLLPHC